MTLAESVSLELVITGEAVPGVNPGWRGTIVASAPFAALLLVRVGDSLSWGKPEVISDTNVPISLYLHPLNWAGTSVQFLFSVGWRGIEDVCVPIAPENLRPPIPTGFCFLWGMVLTVWLCKSKHHDWVWQIRYSFGEIGRM